MTFPLNSYLLAILTAFSVTCLSGFFWTNWGLRSGLVDEPGHRKIHEKPIPLAGGLAIMTGLLVPMLLACLFLLFHSSQALFSISQSGVNENATALLQHGFNRRAIRLIGIFLGAIGILIVGLLDDFHELRPKTKFFGQLAVALVVAACGVRITLFVQNPLFHYVVTILWILTMINAFNFMDNMNGLCAGLAAIGAWYFGLIAASAGQYLVALIAFLTFGSLLGFLPHNFPRARAFLGDAGSHLLGYLMAILAILPHFYTPRHPRPWAVLIPLIVLAIPLADLIWVVIVRTGAGKAFYEGDTNHLSHRIVRMGFSPRRAVLIIWLAAALVGGLAFVIR